MMYYAIRFLQRKITQHTFRNMQGILSYCLYNVARQILMFRQLTPPEKIFLIQQTILPMLRDKFEIRSKNKIHQKS